MEGWRGRWRGGGEEGEVEGYLNAVDEAILSLI